MSDNPFAPPSFDHVAPPTTQWSLTPARTGPVNPWAIVGLVTGILPLFLVGIPASITGLVQTQRRHQRGLGLAVAGLVLSGLWLVFGALAALGLALEHWGPTEQAASLGPVADARGAAQGQCLLLPRQHESAVGSCAADHDAEVFHVGELSEVPWPGVDTMDGLADSVCGGFVFSSYVGKDVESSVFDYGWFAPDEAEWTAGEHRVVCVVLPYDEDLPHRSVRYSGR